MHELRIDPLTGRHVLFAANRSGRPNEFAPAAASRSGGDCPFCLGNEDQTPDEIRRHGGDERGWMARVTSNKYPAVAASSGRHEVVVASPRHVRCMSQLSHEEAYWTLHAFADRLRTFRKEQQFPYAQAFMNVGPAAGASIEHLHGQLLAASFVPPLVAEELAGARRWQERSGRCLFCKNLEDESQARSLAALRSERFAAFCPFASRFPWEVCVAPLRHEARFEEIDQVSLEELAQVLRTLVGRLIEVSGAASYNWLLHTTPFDILEERQYHWHIELFPRLAQAAGFEWGTGCHINTVLPEFAASALRGELEKKFK